ncbi:HigA family addiction module antitoxin [Phenylobacterium sp.]|uniref:HigA family addiction module antitoxin n=1 Tax=Phenylobacterium sp. TaxID=1871053 RepID=UPI0025F01BB8|nr:HigA family addiction module antitoxin [Phenylobacterium sp.]MBX3482561.1 HigA family addiction module antidote protein [Phenylobacterium sp.]MCW5758769.1 HigA family addiction module antidote protein [Phenylobacterium sp.]
MEDRTPTAAAPLKRGLLAMHPGEFLREVTLPALKADQRIGQVDFAERLGISRTMLVKLLNEKSAVSAEMALRLGRVLNTTPEFWLNLQQAHDLARAAAAIGDQVRTLKPVPVAA